MQPIGRRRRWRNVVERAQFNAQLRQLRDPVAGDNIGMALTEALHQAIETELDREQRPAHHFVNFAITAHGFTHAYQTANFTVGEFLQRTARLDEMLATLAGKLNSNEAFNPDRGFQVDVVFVSMPGPGSGRHKQRNAGRLCLDRVNKKKRCIVPIKNRDTLCCARAIIRLLKSNDHFDGCTSFPAFVNRSYYCLDCERGFNTDDRSHHTCQGRRCCACERFDCPEYVVGTRPTEYCSLCHRKFYGHQCKRYHEVSHQCQSIKCCTKCQAQYTVVRHQRHQCGYAKCSVCQEWVPIQDHKCYIQPAVEPEETEPTEEGGGRMVAPPPPLFVYADFEAMQNAEGVFVANLLCYSSSVETTIHVLDGEDCALQFLRDLDDLTDVPDCEDQREILVVFHNLKGFDGMFILHELYQQQREVADQLTVGAKVLSFKSGPLKFIDSLCFLPMPLASFPSTFNLTELKKGFFPHLFNTPDHQQYVGRIPDLEFYDPDGMMAKKKDELTRWHADQVRRNVTFNFQQDMIDYCKSDVALLKAGCEAFQEEFEQQAGFNPMAKCITIASACNLYWRKHHLTPDTIAVEPLAGWRGAQVNQSLKALQWLYYQEHLLPKEGASADRIRHELYQATLAKRTILLRAGYTVLEMWECEWDQWVDTDETVQRFLHSFDLAAPLEPREAFFGGRTGALTFPLCRACVQTEQAQPMLTRTHYCPHSDADRMLRGTWCTPELVKAVEKGYTLIKIHEVWHFPPEQRQTGLFADYVNTWLKLKQESAGWPSWCQTLEQKRHYILRYQEREGIRLDIASIAKNPGRKATAKLMLNSFWGKFGERINKPTTVTVQHPADLFNLISDAALDLSTLRLCTDDILEAVYTSVYDNAVKGTKTNIFIAAFTTCHARLKLYESLDTLQQQVLYYDTDSVVYKWRPGQPSIATGDFLGDMTDELEGDVITEFVSGGAKNYGYQTRGGKVVCKVRGFTLNVRGSAILNFQTMKENILSELDSPQESRRNLNITNPYYFKRDLEQKQIQVVPRVKQYGLVFDKRVIEVATRSSYPYGYERIGDELDLLLDL
ncbi:unnamed protein product [Porites lobata]|uniref:DNA-directed DNA polymerase n=1 Tax=Porites lobata TaxID=104759 RepID=A0ABN8S4P2_9CNID|nr:unnamed protein product [Porites lobata]